MIISFEGCDGTGKSTQAQLLCDRLEKSGKNTKLIHFPRYNTPIGNLIKQALQGKIELTKEALQMMYVADQMDFQEELLNYEKEGYIVVLDRYELSTIVYYMGLTNKKQKKEAFKLVTSWQRGLKRPDVTFILRASKNYLEKRESLDILESNKKLMKRVDELYIEVVDLIASTNEPINYWFILTEETIEEIADTIFEAVKGELAIL